ncbi:MAG: hypothetical protein ACRDPT_02010 [Streptomycetales bacterium]
MGNDTLRERAVALRRQGRSRRQIREALGVTNWELGDWLRGVPAPEWTKRPRAKDDLRDKARELRSQGWTYRQIARGLGVSMSTCSLWLRDMPLPPPEPGSYEQERVAAMWRARWERVLVRREQERQRTKLAASREVGLVDRRLLILVGAIAYWCEGSKDKPYERREQVRFINSDPLLIGLFCRFLDAVAVDLGRRRYHVHIHETADLEAATTYWADLVGIPAEAFAKPVIKRHSPKTNRRNLRENYRGCLQITVLQSAELYRQIDGWATGLMLGAQRAEIARGAPLDEVADSVEHWRMSHVTRSAVG